MNLTGKLKGTAIMGVYYFQPPDSKIADAVKKGIVNYGLFFIIGNLHYHTMKILLRKSTLATFCVAASPGAVMLVLQYTGVIDNPVYHPSIMAFLSGVGASAAVHFAASRGSSAEERLESLIEESCRKDKR